MIKIKIKGDTWKVQVFDNEEFVEKFGEGMAAFADVERHQMFFDAEDLNLQVVRHEVFHAFTSYLHLDAVALQPEQLEEIYCEMFAKDGPKMMALSQKLFTRLRRME